ncbi:MAG: lysophospholipid acyltransferase family protein [Planctomycetota bacterium]
MSDRFYDFMCAIGSPPFSITHRPTTLDTHHTDRPGAYLLASNHTCPYDIPILMYHSRRRLDFVSTTEVLGTPLLGRFYRALNAFPLDRSRVDAATVRVILARLRRQRVVAMFPEGGFRFQDRSVLHGGSLRHGIGRIARLAQAPVIPCAIENAMVYSRFRGWLPRCGRYGVAYGPAMAPPDAMPDASPEHVEAVARDYEADIARQIRDLHKRLLQAMKLTESESATRRYRSWRK